MFAYVYQIRARGIRIKEWNKPIYYLMKWLLIAIITYTIVVGF